MSAFPSAQTHAAFQAVAGSGAELGQATANESQAQQALAAAQQTHDIAVKAREAARARHQQHVEALHAAIASDTGVPAVPAAPVAPEAAK